MTEENVRKAMQEGFDKVKPIVANMTSELMNAYELGFKTCFKLLTGQEIFELWHNS